MTFPIKLDFVRDMTDEVGMLQHSKFATPNRKEGYTTDDNARALIACTNYLKLFNDTSVKKLINTYLSLLFYMQRTDGKMHNYLSYDRKILDEVGSEDSMGRTLWACGYCLGSELSEEIGMLSKEIFDKVFRWTSGFRSPRAKAYSILGLFYYQKAHPDDPNLNVNITSLADQLTRQFEMEATSEWSWFESYMTYCNARIPHSLFLAYETTREKRYLQVASKSMKFLINVQTMDKLFVPIGNRGWFRRGSNRAIFDQQSIEASCTIEAAVTAFKNTNETSYLDAAYNAFEWFLGKNTKGLRLYDPENGSCCDGITAKGLNLNKGAEATLAYLQARLKIEELKNMTSVK